MEYVFDIFHDALDYFYFLGLLLLLVKVLKELSIFQGIIFFAQKFDH